MGLSPRETVRSIDQIFALYFMVNNLALERQLMVLIPVRCPHCGQINGVKRGQTANDKQRYLCRKIDCSVQTFILDYEDRGRIPEVKSQIIDMTLNGSGIRDIARVLRISSSTVMNEIKKESLLNSVNYAVLNYLNHNNTIVYI